MSSNRKLILILLIGLAIRLYHINLPLLDTKPHREIHTAEETRNLYYDKELLYPKSKLWADEPGFYLAEFPIYNMLVAITYMLTGVNEVWGRLISVAASFGLALYFYYFVRDHFDKQIALMATGFFYILSPQNIILSRSYQPDQLGLFFGMVGLYNFSLWLRTSRRINYYVSFIAFTLMFLTKFQFFSFALPIIYLALKKYGRNIFKQKLLWWFGLSLIPFVLWYLHLTEVYRQNPHLHSAPLLNPGSWIDLSQLLNVRWLVNITYDFSQQVTTLPVLLLAVIGFFGKNIRNRGLLHAWIIGLITYFLLFIGKIHFWYYQVPFLFPATILAAIALSYLWPQFKKRLLYPKLSIAVVGAVLILLTSSPYVLRTYKIDYRHRAVIETGQQLKKLAPQYSKIIASSYNSAALTYYSLRPDMWGGTLDINEANCDLTCITSKFENLRDWGALYYGISDKTEFDKNPEFLSYLDHKYPKIRESDDYVIYDLH